MSEPAHVTTAEETIGAILKRSKRPFVPIRKTFLQHGDGKARLPGPLATLVKNKDERGLDLYLLVHSVTSNAPYDVTLSAPVWARGLHLPDNRSSWTSVSKALARLRKTKLVETSRKGKYSRIVLLDEGGGGDVYQHPSKSEGAARRYLKLPHAYWTDGYHQKLKLPGKAILLILLSLPDGSILPIEKGPDWYGISADTVQRGLKELEKLGLIGAANRPKPAPLTPKGFTIDRCFTLQPPFGPLGRARKGLK